MGTTVHTCFLFLIWYAGWLIPLPALSFGGSCRHNKSAAHSTPVCSAGMVHTYDLAQLCGSLQTLEGGATSVRFIDSMPPPASVAISVLDGAGVAIVVGVVLSTIATSSASAAPSSASAITSLLRLCSRAHCVLALRSSGVLVAPEVGPAVFEVRPAGSLLLPYRACLVAFAFSAHLLLNAKWFPLQLGHFSCVWLQREPCFALHPTMLHLWVLVQCGPEP